MQSLVTIKNWLGILILLSITACAQAGQAVIVASPSPKQPPTVATASPTIIPTQELPSPTSTPIVVPTQTTTPTPDIINALVWRDNLQVPVILYHRFLPVGAKESSKTKMRLEDFQDQIQALYDAGYSLVPMEKWLAGDISLPVGRRPLILTMDDLFFADQIYIEADGSPSIRSGLGLLWRFSQQHPDFGFSATLFFNLGDKYYGNKKTATWFLVSDGWQDALATAIVWCIEHNAMPYNHTYMHSSLDELDALGITDELRRNDLELRKFLKRAHREDLIPRLDNYIALPFGVWPATKGLTNYMFDYKDPEDKPVSAVFEAGYFYEERYLPAPFAPGFDRFHIPRITTNTRRSIEFLTNQRSRFPRTEHCNLGSIPQSMSNDPDMIKKLIHQAILLGNCPEGYYRVGNYFFEAKNGDQNLVWTVPTTSK
jgi:hypothetical protein